jgi:hypothetical protein
MSKGRRACSTAATARPETAALAAASEPRARLADRYTAFATDEARGASLGVAASPPLLDFLLTLPSPRRQPNLFLAAVRHLHGVPETIDELTAIIRQDEARIRELMLSRTTQTNEPARCAVLLPLLAQLPEPLALLEVGASAGLCLLLDRYGYDYGSTRIAPAAADAPIFRCRATGAIPLPRAVPEIVWRRGLDLNPIDLCSGDDVAWLESLVWPEQEARARNLRAVIDIARRDPPLVVKGDLLADLEPLIKAAPRDATLVVFHTAVLPYVSSALREQFVATVTTSRAVWISNEAPGVFPTLTATAPLAPAPGQFVLMRDGVPLAWAHPHGQSIDWFGPPS